MLLIIDNQSRFIKQFKVNFLAEQEIPFIIFDHNQPIVLPKDMVIKGIILSGGKGNPYDPLNLTSNFVAMISFDVPIAGFCLGHEIIAAAYRGRIKKMANFQHKREKVRILKPEDPIFEGSERGELVLRKRHHFQITELPDSFVTLAESEACRYEIIRHISKPIYGFQSHPEASGKDGMLLINNFLKICNIYSK